MKKDARTWRVHAMGTHFNFQLRQATPRHARRLAEATERLLQSMETSWSRFREDSELSALNQTGELAHPSTLLRLAVFEALTAHRLTGGHFDPRVKRALEHLGYERSFTEVGTGAELAPRPAASPARPPSEFCAIFDEHAGVLSIGSEPIDLGGIGKGLALRMLSDHLRHSDSGSHLIEAGGDIRTYLDSHDPDPWFVDIEDPFSSASLPMLVRVGTGAVATSSVKVRNWKVGGQTKHHIIDPATMDSAESDLYAVTVVDTDSARAEVFSKWIFLRGGAGGMAICREREIAALMIGRDGGVRYSPAWARYMQVQAEASTRATGCVLSDVSSPLEPLSVSA
ncbi:MAG: FAD:protein FMN transferase [Actinomycetota bacterium]|nr:FAD:protein FMN transferase [Actinomycetota bacterium]